jgi:hypothetical protein
MQTCRPARTNPYKIVIGLSIISSLYLLLTVPEGWAQQGGPRTVSATATLSILKGSVSRISAAGGDPQAATDGMNLVAGDRLLTAPKSEALVTFLDGSTLTVMPDSDVTVKKAEVGRKSSTISIRINVGKVWARVVRLVDPKSSFSLESNTATATVHDGLIGGQQDKDGGFTCWTKAGNLTVTDDKGVTLVLMPGQKTLVKPGQPTVPQPFAVHQSTIKVTAPAHVLPLIVMDDQVRVAGFVAPGAEVNQVFGSYTGAAADGSWTVEVPAGVPGPFMLVLEGREEGPFTVAVAGIFKGTQVYRQDLTGRIKRGERLTTKITQQLDPATATDPKTAKVHNGTLDVLQPMSGPVPGNILLAPDELQAAGRP